MGSLKRAYAGACKRSFKRFKCNTWDQWVDEAREKASGRMSGTNWRELLAQGGLCPSTSYQADQQVDSGTFKSISNGSSVAPSQEATQPSVGWGSHDPGPLSEGQFGINGIQTDQNLVKEASRDGTIRPLLTENVPPQKAAERPKMERDKTPEQARSPGHNELRIDSKVESMIDREATELYDHLRAQKLMIDQLKHSVLVAEGTTKE
jgi:hypothetical protein